METSEEQLKNLELVVKELTLRVGRLEVGFDHHDKILVRGYDDHLPLAEIVRTLAKTVYDYIARKDKEETLAKERKDKLMWIFISASVPILLAYLIPVFVLIFKIYPLLEKLGE